MPDPWSENRHPADKYYGKYPGLVADNTAPKDDPENPDKIHRGELLVEVPGILEESKDGKGERPIQVWAKPCFHPGFFFIPEVGAQVWVEFVAGDVNQPVWTGVWYPLAETPKTVTDEAPTEHQKVIRTASGHVIQLDDTGDKPAIVIRHTKKDGAKIQIDKNGSVLIDNGKKSFLFLNAEGGEVTLMDENQNLVTLTKNGIALANADSTIIEMKGKQVTVVAADLAVVSAKDVVFKSGTVTLGDGAGESAVLGDTFGKMWDAMMMHTHPTGVGPSGPPVVPPAGPPVLIPGNGLSTSVKVK
jgi:hypothetical protein